MPSISISDFSCGLQNHDSDNQHGNSTWIFCCRLKLLTSKMKVIFPLLSPSAQTPDIPICVGSLTFCPCLMQTFFGVVLVFQYPLIFLISNMFTSPNFYPAENISSWTHIPLPTSLAISLTPAFMLIMSRQLGLQLLASSNSS